MTQCVIGVTRRVIRVKLNSTASNKIQTVKLNSNRQCQLPIQSMTEKLNARAGYSAVR
jgi:hypothetical protein